MAITVGRALTAYIPPSAHSELIAAVQRTGKRRKSTTSSSIAAKAVTPTRTRELDKPFTLNELSRISSLLAPVPTHRPGSFPPHTASFALDSSINTGSASRKSHGPKEAAILIPLLNVDNRPCVLLEVRATKMRTHAGEVRYVFLSVCDQYGPRGRADALHLLERPWIGLI